MGMVVSPVFIGVMIAIGESLGNSPSHGWWFIPIVGKRIINYPPVITILIGGIRLPFPVIFVVYDCFNHNDPFYWWLNEALQHQAQAMEAMEVDIDEMILRVPRGRGKWASHLVHGKTHGTMVAWGSSHWKLLKMEANWCFGAGSSRMMKIWNWYDICMQEKVLCLWKNVYSSCTRRLLLSQNRSIRETLIFHSKNLWFLDVPCIIGLV